MTAVLNSAIAHDAPAAPPRSHDRLCIGGEWDARSTAAWLKPSKASGWPAAINTTGRLPDAYAQ